MPITLPLSLSSLYLLSLSLSLSHTHTHTHTLCVSFCRLLFLILVVSISPTLCLQPTQFSLASSATDDQKTWAYLKRTKDKTGLSFKLLRKVMEVQA